VVGAVNEKNTVGGLPVTVAQVLSKLLAETVATLFDAQTRADPIPPLKVIGIAEEQVSEGGRAVP